MNKWTKNVLISLLATAAALPLVASAQRMMGMAQGTRMQVQQSQQGGVPMMQEHIQKMEAHMATIEDLLRQLVEQQEQ